MYTQSFEIGGTLFLCLRGGNGMVVFNKNYEEKDYVDQLEELDWWIFSLKDERSMVKHMIEVEARQEGKVESPEKIAELWPDEDR